MDELRASGQPSVASLDEARAVWEVNVFGVLAVYPATLPLLRRSSDARIVNVTSTQGSLTTMADPATPLHKTFEPVYSASQASQAALNAVTLSVMIELEATDIKVNLVSPGFANTALVNFQGTESVEDACREVLRVARLRQDGPTGTFTLWDGVNLPW